MPNTMNLQLPDLILPGESLGLDNTSTDRDLFQEGIRTQNTDPSNLLSVTHTARPLNFTINCNLPDQRDQHEALVPPIKISHSIRERGLLFLKKFALKGYPDLVRSLPHHFGDAGKVEVTLRNAADSQRWFSDERPPTQRRYLKKTPPVNRSQTNVDQSEPPDASCSRVSKATTYSGLRSDEIYPTTKTLARIVEPTVCNEGVSLAVDYDQTENVAQQILRRKPKHQQLSYCINLEAKGEDSGYNDENIGRHKPQRMSLPAPSTANHEELLPTAQLYDIHRRRSVQVQAQTPIVGSCSSNHTRYDPDGIYRIIQSPIQAGFESGNFNATHENRSMTVLKPFNSYHSALQGPSFPTAVKNHSVKNKEIEVSTQSPQYVADCSQPANQEHKHHFKSRISKSTVLTCNSNPVSRLKEDRVIVEDPPQTQNHPNAPKPTHTSNQGTRSCTKSHFTPHQEHNVDIPQSAERISQSTSRSDQTAAKQSSPDTTFISEEARDESKTGNISLTEATTNDHKMLSNKITGHVNEMVNQVVTLRNMIVHFKVQVAQCAPEYAIDDELQLQDQMGFDLEHLTIAVSNILRQQHILQQRVLSLVTLTSELSSEKNVAVAERFKNDVKNTQHAISSAQHQMKALFARVTQISVDFDKKIYHANKGPCSSGARR